MSTDDQFRADLTALIPNLRAFAHSLCIGRAAEGDDLAQEALAKAWAARASFQPGTNLKAWAFMILRNQFISQRRRAWRDQPLDPDVAERTLVQNPEGASRLELDELRRALAMLPDAQREALILVAAGDVPYEQAADILGVRIGTIKSRVSRGRETLAEIMAKGELKPFTDAPEQALESLVAEARLVQARSAADRAA